MTAPLHASPCDGVEVLAPPPQTAADVLAPSALAFVRDLVRVHRPRLERLLALRAERLPRLAAGGRLDFPEATRSIREADWRVEPAPPDLQRRFVEITGPVDRKTIVNALNSGADVFMADFEDANAPTWSNVVQGQQNLADAVRRRIDFEDPARGKSYRLAEETATLVVRPRGLHLPEAHLRVDGRPAPACLFDAALYLHRNAHALLESGTGPYLYLPKLEGAQEAAFWRDVLLDVEERLGLEPGTVRVTVLIETVPAMFEMDEILHELRPHVTGLNCGRWDSIFSFIKTHRHRPDLVLPDRARVTMETGFLSAYSRLLVKTCHRRGAHAMGGMAAQIPVKNDPAANERALEAVRRDKLREVDEGHDGTWVAHPGLVALAREVFEGAVQGEHQLHVLREDVRVTAEDLHAVPEGERTEAGLRRNIEVGVRYLAAWLSGSGCVPIHRLMEDAATAEICRSQIWQWVRHGVRLEDGRVVDRDLVLASLREELKGIEQPRAAEAATLFEEIALADDLPEFLTLVAYPRLLAASGTGTSAHRPEEESSA